MAEQSSGSGNKCVIEKPSGWSNLIRGEDWLAVWLGFLIIVLILAGVRPKMPSFKWETSGEFATTVEKSKPKIEKFIADAQAKRRDCLSRIGNSAKNSIGFG